MVTATPAQQRQLLAIQRLDTRRAQLERRAHGQAEQQAVEESAAALRAIARAMTAAADRLDALRGEDQTATSTAAIATTQRDLAEHRRRGEALAQRHRQLVSEAAAAPDAVAADLARLTAERAAAAAAVPPDLLERYREARARLGEVAVVPVVAGRGCGGCNLAIPAVELEAAREASRTALPRCPECDRLLVFDPDA